MSETPAHKFKFELVPNGVIFHQELTLAEIGKALDDFGRMGKSLPWWIGDMINYAEHKHGEKYAQAINMQYFAYGTLRNYASLSKAFPKEKRIEGLEASHHIAVMGLAPVDRVKVLNNAVKRGLTVRELQEEVQKILPPHKQEDRWMSFATWWETYCTKHKVGEDEIIISQKHAHAGWDAALEKGLKPHEA